MSSKREKELKEPDAFVETASQLWTFVHAHFRIIVTATLVLFGGGAIVVAFQYYSTGREESAQAAYYLLEKDLLKLQEDFASAKEKVAKKSDKDASSSEEDRSDGVVDKESKLPSGDLKQDYGMVVDRYLEFIKAYPQSQASVVAALTISEIFEEYKQFDEALKVMDEVSPSKGSLLYAMAEVRRGHLHAEKGECDRAIKIFDGIASGQEYTYLRPFALLKKGTCHQLLGEKDLALGEFKKIDSEFKDKSVGRTGKSFSRLIQVQGK